VARPKPLHLTVHAEDAVAERELQFEWIARAVHDPEWTSPDPRRPDIERRYRVIPEHGGRVLRVACYETATEIRIITAFFDRDAKRPK